MTAQWPTEHAETSSPAESANPESVNQIVLDPPSYPESFYYRIPDEPNIEVDHGPLWKRYLGIAVAILTLLWSWHSYSESRPLPPCGPFPDPIQVKLNQPLRLAGPNGVTYEATDTYDVSGLVVSRARYWFGEQAAYCPVDLAIAWGPLTTTEKLSAVRYSQSNRWYWFRHNGTNGVDNPMIIRYSANNHMIPATGDKTVRRLLLGVRRGDRVRIRGYLVNVTDSKGRTLRTSRERDDTGAGSCEIIFVTDVEKLP